MELASPIRVVDDSSSFRRYSVNCAIVSTKAMWTCCVHHFLHAHRLMIVGRRLGGTREIAMIQRANVVVPEPTASC
jgi:hypothetical protein